MFSASATRALLTNLRPPQIAFHIGALALGGSISTLLVSGAAAPSVSFGHGALLCVSVVAAWITSLLLNDVFDQKIDRATNPQRPLSTGQMHVRTFVLLALIFFVLSLGIAALYGQFIFALIGLYHIIAFAYNVPPLRLKRVPLLATFLIALSLQLAVFAGFVLAQGAQSLAAYPFSAENIFLSLLCVSLFLSLKDLKDVAGDRTDGVSTLPIIFGRRTARFIATSGLAGFFFVTAIEHGGTDFLWIPVSASVLAYVLFCLPRCTFVTDRTVLWWAFVPVVYFSAALFFALF